MADKDIVYAGFRPSQFESQMIKDYMVVNNYSSIAALVREATLRMIIKGNPDPVASKLVDVIDNATSLVDIISGLSDVSDMLGRLQAPHVAQNSSGRPSNHVEEGFGWDSDQ